MTLCRSQPSGFQMQIYATFQLLALEIQAVRQFPSYIYWRLNSFYIYKQNLNYQFILSCVFSYLLQLISILKEIQKRLLQIKKLNMKTKKQKRKNQKSSSRQKSESQSDQSSNQRHKQRSRNKHQEKNQKKSKSKHRRQKRDSQFERQRNTEHKKGNKKKQKNKKKHSYSKSQSQNQNEKQKGKQNKRLKNNNQQQQEEPNKQKIQISPQRHLKNQNRVKHQKRGWSSSQEREQEGPKETKHDKWEIKQQIAYINKQQKPPKQLPNFQPSGILLEYYNARQGVSLKFNEPPQAHKPINQWRIYPFKDDTSLNPIILSESCYLVGKDERVCDILCENSSISRQHAVIQFRSQYIMQIDGSYTMQVKPYILDLQSTNGTLLNEEKIQPSRYYQLLNKDVLKFGLSNREYIMYKVPEKDDQFNQNQAVEQE